MNKKRVVSATVVTGALALSLTGCWDDNSSKSTAQQKEQSQASNAASALVTNQPVHSYSYSQIKQNLQEVEDAQANGTVTTSFFMNMGVADPVMSCPSIGAPIASTTELTNPQQLETHYSGQTGAVSGTIGQMDPTGVYTGNSSGTYIMCVGANGQVNPVYWEGFVMTAFGPAHWDKASHMMVIDGPSSSKFSNIKK
jgi:hypothetical protein